MNKLIWIVVLLLYAILINIYTLGVSFPDFETLRAMGSWGIGLLLLCIISWHHSGKELISPYIFFLIALFIFSYGQSLLYTFDLISERRDLIGQRGVTIPQIYEAQKATIYMLIAFHIGALFVDLIRKKQTINTAITEEGPIYINGIQALKKIGITLFVVSFIPYFYELIHNMIISITLGYVALYEGKVKIGFANSLSFIADLFIPSLICLFVAFKDNKRIIRIIYGLSGFIILSILITGGRTEAVILLSLIILLRHIVIKNFNKKELFIIAIVGCFTLSALTIIGNTRTQKHRNLDSFTSVNEKHNQNAAVDAIAEMGWSMFPLIKTQGIVPENQEYRYGKSYLYSLTTLIPNMGFWEIHPAKKEANLSSWLSRTLNASFGTGYSMCAEAYINFGPYAPIMMLILGMAISFVLSGFSSQNNKNIPFLIFSIIIFWFCLKLPRNSFIGIVRSIFFYTLPIYLYIKYKIAKSIN